MNSFEVKHRFANKDFGRNGELHASSVHCDKLNYYSYSTVFAQWVDKQKNVCLVFEGSTSNTSSKHMMSNGDFPEDVTVFPYNDGGKYSWWCGCNLIGGYGGGSYGNQTWRAEDRYKLIKYYIKSVYAQMSEIKDCKKKGCENISLQPLKYAEQVISMYRDTTWKGFIESLKQRNKVDLYLIKFTKNLRYAVAHLTGNELVKYVCDRSFGKGTFDKYWKYSERFRKADARRAHIHCVRRYLREWDMPVHDLLALTPSQRYALKMHNIERIKETAIRWSERRDRDNKRLACFASWICGGKSNIRNIGDWSTEFRVLKVSKGGECLYTYRQVFYVFVEYEFPVDIKIDMNVFKSYCESDDKQRWLDEFYNKARLTEANSRAEYLFQLYGDSKGKAEGVENNYFMRIFELKPENVSKLSADDIACVNDFIRRRDDYIHQVKVDERVRRMEEEKRKERELKEKKAQAQAIAEAIERLACMGVEGARDIWRLHYRSISFAEDLAKVDEKSFYENGNVLLRIGLNGKSVETSKDIRLSFKMCDEWWPIVQKWHEHPESFETRNIKTLTGTYTIVSYKNDVLTAGCHQISYAEMKNVMRQVKEIEKNAA